MKRYPLLLTLFCLHNAYASKRASAGSGSHSSAAAAIMASASSSAMAQGSSDSRESRLKRACPESQALTSKKAKVDVQVKEQLDEKAVQEKIEADVKLGWAVHFDRMAQARSLLSAGADANAKGLLASKILGEATTVEMAELLIEYGAEQTLKTHGEDCLEHAVSNSLIDQSVVQWYIAKGLAVNGPPSNPRFLLHAALIYRDYGHLEVITHLIDAGARLDACCNSAFPKKYHGLNVPQLMRCLDNPIMHMQDPEALHKIKDFLVTASHERQIVSLLKKSVLVHLLKPKLCNLIASYYVAHIVEDEKPYEELEKSKTLSIALS